MKKMAFLISTFLILLCFLGCSKLETTDITSENSSNTATSDYTSTAVILTQTDDFVDLSADSKQKLNEFINVLTSGLLSYTDGTFDSNNIDPNEAILDYIICLGLYNQYFDFGIQDDVNDPSGWYSNVPFNVSSYEAQEVDWLLINILNIDPEHRDTPYTTSNWTGQSVYFDSTDYYVTILPTGLNGFQGNIQNIEVIDTKNHIYEVKYKYYEYAYEGEPDKNEGILNGKFQIKNIDGNYYWSVLKLEKED